MPAYIFQLIAESNTPILREVFKKVKFFFSIQKTNFSKNSFFTAVIMEWEKIDINIRNSALCNVFQKIILKFIRHEPNQVFNVVSSDGLKFVTRRRLGLSHLADLKFRHSFFSFIVAASRLKLQPISSFIVLITIVQDKLSLKK